MTALFIQIKELVREVETKLKYIELENEQAKTKMAEIRRIISGEYDDCR